MNTPGQAKTIYGVGIGLRACHYQHIINTKPDVPWFEGISENYFCAGGKHHAYLEQVRSHYPLVFHGVGLSIGSESLSTKHLDSLKTLKNRYQPAWFSEHLCFTNHGCLHGHDLWPVPYNQKTLIRTANNIQQAQEALGEKILIENISAYASFDEDAMNEWDFIAELLEKADCYLLLDINNIYVSAYNLGFSAEEFLQNIPINRVKQMHLGGFKDCGQYYLDDHGHTIHENVWSLYEKALERFGQIPTLIEWDNQIPSFERLQQEQYKAQACMENYHDPKKIHA